MKCEKCKKEVEKIVEEYSSRNFKGKIFCRDCQKDVRAMIKTAQTGETKSKPIVNDSEPNRVKTIMLNGKEFVTHAGLLEVAHKLKVCSITTEAIEITEERAFFKAKVIMPNNRIFTGYGDADKSNVNQMILPHKIRMAETRAINRALRFATNIGLCSIEELGGDTKEK